MRFVRGWELRSSGDLPTITLIQTAASVFTMETTWNLLIWCPRMEKRHGPGFLALNTCWQASVTRTAWQKDNGHEINILLIVSTYGLNPLIAMEARFCHWIKRYKLAYLRKFLRSFLKNLNSEKSQNCEIKIHNYFFLFFIQWRKRASIHGLLQFVKMVVYSVWEWMFPYILLQMVETDLFRSRQKWRWQSEHWRGFTVAP